MMAVTAYTRKQLRELEEELNILRIRAEDAELLAERRKWGAEEMDRLRVKYETSQRELSEAQAQLTKITKALQDEIDNCYICGGRGSWIEHGYKEDCPHCTDSRAAIDAAEPGGGG